MFTRRSVLKGIAAGSTIAAVTLHATANAAETIRFTVPDGRFEKWDYARGDELTLTAEIVPIVESGMAVIVVGNSRSLIHAEVGCYVSGKQTDTILVTERPGGSIAWTYNRQKEGATRGHRIVGHTRDGKPVEGVVS